jgi:hypothetical protein
VDAEEELERALRVLIDRLQAQPVDKGSTAGSREGRALQLLLRRVCLLLGMVEWLDYREDSERTKGSRKCDREDRIPADPSGQVPVTTLIARIANSRAIIANSGPVMRGTESRFSMLTSSLPWT